MFVNLYFYDNTHLEVNATIRFLFHHSTTFLSQVTQDVVQEKILNSGLEVLTCHSTKTALFNEVHISCTYLSCLWWNMWNRARKGHASLLFLNIQSQTTATEPILHRTH